MTDTNPMNIDAMRHHAATVVLGYRYCQNGEQPFYETDELALDVLWLDNWTPDTDWNQAGMLLEKMDQWHHPEEIWAGDCVGVAVNGSGMVYANGESFPLAVLIAVCKATGYVGVEK